MRSSLFSWLFFIIVLLKLLYVNTNIVSGQCLSDQRLLLLELNKSLIFDDAITTGLSWSQTSDCCRFQGVTCDEEGHVIGLNLSNKMIIGGLDNSSALFDLQHLQKLDLSQNSFKYSSVPSRIGELTNLTYLNLSIAEFTGQIPREISHLRRLVVLDLSYNIYMNPNLSELFKNLIDLQELFLDLINISSSGQDWCQGLSYLHNLRVLSMCECSLSGPIDSSLAKLQSLSVLRLSDNGFFSPVPKFFANFLNLTELSLKSCKLNGTFPKEIFQMPTLKVLDISENPSLQVSVTEFPQINSFEELVLSYTNFSESLPTSIDKLLNLSKLSLGGLQFSGTFPKSIRKLRRLFYLDLSHNKFSGHLPEFLSASSSLLTDLVLSYNNLEGHIPMSTFQLKNLNTLSLSFNKFNGTINFINMIQGLPNLYELGLSCNNLTVKVSDKEEESTLISLHKFKSLHLASCRLRKFPFLKNQTVLTILDLSNNQIGGEIPSWIWELGSLFYLNLSSNQLVRMQESYSLKSLNHLKYLDLHNNQLVGTIPIPPIAMFIDLSWNNFTSIPVDIGHYIESLYFLFLSNNGLTGVIPRSLCNGSFLRVLDLSNNHFSGSIPTCLFNAIESMGVLKLRNNNFNGIIADEFRIGCGLRTLDLNGNEIGGRIPRSLANCNFLQVLTLGNNNMVDTFPLFLNTSALHVLILRSNNFYGRIECSKTNPNWEMLQIIDISQNHFGGELPMRCLMTWKAMIVDQSPNTKNDSDSLSYIDPGANIFYRDTVMVTNKGQDRELVKILTIFTCIDFSSNNFTGHIPEEFGQLQSLYVLNLSHNALTYHLPSSLGNLHHLESLDLSWNQLNGTIPLSLTKLNFLSIFNVSYNHLVGNIPKGNQFQAFPPDSFIGNKDLSGCPLVNCSNDENSPKMVTDVVPRSEIDWDVIFAVIGFVFGFGVVTVPLVFSKRWRKLYFKRVEDIGYKIIPLLILKKWWMRKAPRQGRGQQRR